MGDGYGLNKLARLQAERKGPVVPSLNPEFPYDVEPFDPGFFGLEEWSDQEDTKPAL